MSDFCMAAILAQGDVPVRIWLLAKRHNTLAKTLDLSV